MLLLYVWILHRMAEDAAPSLLLSLPDPCLLAVLQCCAADNQRSLLSAARVHSRLHQAAALALRSINIIATQQQQADSVMQYLQKHGEHVNGLEITGPSKGQVSIFQLPPDLRLHSLQLQGLFLGPQVLLAATGTAALRQLQV
jgi:hypothetical protein